MILTITHIEKMDIETLKKANVLTETIAKVERQLKYWESHRRSICRKKLCKLYKHKSCRYLEVEKQVSYFRTRI